MNATLPMVVVITIAVTLMVAITVSVILMDTHFMITDIFVQVI